MKKLILHIGFHKTATSTIQHFLFRNRRKLKKSGCLYLETGMAGYAHGALANALKPENRNIEKGLLMWNKALDELASSSCSLGLVSSECFIESQRIPEVLALAGKRADIELQVLAYLRDQSGWIQSVFNEVVKDPMRRFTGDIFHLREYRQGRLNYYDTLSSWASWIGDENIHLRAFNSALMKNANPVIDFIDAIDDVNLLSVEENERQALNKNVSMRTAMTEFLRRCNLLPMQVEAHQRMVKALIQINENLADWDGFAQTRKDRLTNDEKQFIFEQCLSNNRLLESRWSDVDLGLTRYEAETTDDGKVLPLITADIEHRIIDELPEEVLNHLEKASDRIKGRKAKHPFLPFPSSDEAARLRAVIMRQRMELRSIYAEKGIIV